MAGFPLNETSCYAPARDKANEVISEKVYIQKKYIPNSWLWSKLQNKLRIFYLRFASSANATGS